MQDINLEYNDTGTLKKKYTPSKWLEDITYIPVTQLRIYYGNGIHHLQYVLRPKEIPNNSIVEFTNVNDSTIKINTSFIIDAQDFTLAIAQLDITEYKMQQPSYGQNELPDIETYFTLIDDKTTLTLLD